MMFTTYLAEHGAVLAQLTPHSADGIRDTVLGCVMALGVAVTCVSLLVKFGEQRHGQMVGVAVGATLVLGATAMPDVLVSTLVGLFSSVFGGGS